MYIITSHKTSSKIKYFHNLVCHSKCYGKNKSRLKYKLIFNYVIHLKFSAWFRLQIVLPTSRSQTSIFVGDPMHILDIESFEIHHKCMSTPLNSRWPTLGREVANFRTLSRFIFSEPKKYQNDQIIMGTCKGDVY